MLYQPNKKKEPYMDEVESRALLGPCEKARGEIHLPLSFLQRNLN